MFFGGHELSRNINLLSSFTTITFHWATKINGSRRTARNELFPEGRDSFQYMVKGWDLFK